MGCLSVLPNTYDHRLVEPYMENNSRDLNLEKKIDAYIKGHLNEQEAEELWAELLKRPDYIDLLETELSVKAIIEEKLAARNSKDLYGGDDSSSLLASIRSWKWLAAAAAVAILIIAINLLTMDTDQTLQQVVLKEINLVENLASSAIVRTQKNEISTVDSLLNQGFKAAISGNTGQALTIYKTITSDYGDTPVAARAYLNIGIIRYNSRDYEPAAAAFEHAVEKENDDPVLREKAYWYLGNAYIKLGQLKKARIAVHNAYSQDGLYRKPSFRLLRKLDFELGNIDSDDLKNR